MEEFGVSSMERLFPHAGEYEPRTRKEGLHRWYVLRYAESVPFTRAGAGFENIPGVEYVEPVRAIKLDTYNDLTSDLWGLDNTATPGFDINVLPVWENYTMGNPEVIVSVVDNGVDIKHEDLAANCLSTGHYNAVDGNYSIVPGSHGTHVAGTIAAVGNNGKGVIGVAGGNAAKNKSGVKIMSCQIFKDTAEGSVSGNSGNAIKWGADHGAVISQNSWGYQADANGDGTISADELKVANSITVQGSDKAAIDYFIKYAGCDNNGNQLPDSPMKGGVVIFAAGNDALTNAAPANYEPVIAVGSVAMDGSRSSFSNYGNWVDIAAPGSAITSTIPGDKYGSMSGTSMACPHVSGVAALGLSYAAKLKKHFKAKDFIELLYQTATPIDQYMTGIKQYKKYIIDLEGSSPMMSFDMKSFKGGMGHGQVNAYALLKAVEGAGVEMTFPNIYVAEGGQATAVPSMYMDGSSFSVSVSDTSVATAEIVGGKMIIKGLKAGQTEASVTGSRTDKFVITVREGAKGNGWL
jgi:subtilisin family serine protease